MSNRLRDNAERALPEGGAASEAMVVKSRVGPKDAALSMHSFALHGASVAQEGSGPGAHVTVRGTLSSRGPRGEAGACAVDLSGDLVAKRTFDVIFAFVLLVIVAPLMLLLCAAVRVTSPGPAIFVQPRVGRHGQLFPCLKFRTMVIDAAEQLERLLEVDPVARIEWERDQKLRNDVRVTSLGRFLRKTSLDELPQLFNILLGHMSVVGPRPIVVNEIERYGIHFTDYCAVRPGLTGLWQVGGRNDVDYAARVAYDVEYARTWCFSRDLAICWKTVPAIVLARGCY